jgi:hypothetical protein
MPEMNEHDAYNRALMALSEAEVIDIHEVVVELKPAICPAAGPVRMYAGCAGRRSWSAREVRRDGPSSAGPAPPDQPITGSKATHRCRILRPAARLFKTGEE